MLGGSKGRGGSLASPSLVAVTLARFLEGSWDKAAVYLEASEYLWEAAQQVRRCVLSLPSTHALRPQDHDNGCTDPPELLRLHARDAQYSAVHWFEHAANTWMHADVLLQGAERLKCLGEFEEAAFMASRAALLEKRDDGSLFDAYCAHALAAECYALNARCASTFRVRGVCVCC